MQEEMGTIKISERPASLTAVFMANDVVHSLTNVSIQHCIHITRSSFDALALDMICERADGLKSSGLNPFSRSRST